MQDIVVTASRSAEALPDVVGDVSVIGPEQLAAARGDSLAQIIGRVPGAQFVTTGGPQTTTSLFLRGADTKHTLVLVDGVRVNGSTTGGVQLPAIDPAVIERIEILRGAASSLYGSDAIGGVINIITSAGKQDQPLSAWFNAGYGTHDTAKSSLGLSGAANGWDYRFSASAGTSRGFDSQRRSLSGGSPNANWYPDRDGYTEQAFSGALGYRWAPGHRLALTAYHGTLRGDYDTANYNVYPAVPVETAQSKARQQVYTLTSMDTLADFWDSTLKFGFSKDAYEDIAVERSTFNSIKRQYTWQNDFSVHADHRLTLLLERQEERLQTSTAYDRTARDTNAIALIARGHAERLHYQASVRNDNISGYGNQATGSLGLDFDITPHWQIGAAGSTAFHAPTFNELYWPLSYGFRGNPDLNPESARNVEAHVAFDDGESRFRATLYHNRISDLIATVCDAFYNCTTENVNQATLRGVTLSGERDFGQTTLRASADFLDPRNDTPKPGQTGSELPLRARQVFHLGLEHRIQALKLGAEYQYTGNRYADAANTIRLGGYSLVNLSAAYDFSKSLGVQVRWDNVLDKDYTLMDGYHTAGSSVFVNLSWRM